MSATALTISLSAFLLFLIEPMVGKILLPWFGGTSLVWATSLVFFSTTLFAGYAYVVWLTRYSAAFQRKVHITLCAVSAALVLLLIISFGVLHVPLPWFQGSISPPLLILGALSTSIGIPFFLLATTGPLLQYWYSAHSGKDPYILYALSNAGSLLALCAYPFLIEPAIPLSLQQLLWAGLFCLCALALFLLARRFTPEASAVPKLQRPAWSTSLVWIVLALFPSYLLVSATTEITQIIAPLPLLWIVPLSLYLLSFILGFSIGYGRLPAILLLSAGLTMYITLSLPVFYTLGVTLIIFFAAAWYCHGRLYDLRPEPASLPWFYMCISGGGMMGTILAALIGPLLLPNIWEFTIGVALSSALIFAELARHIRSMRLQIGALSLMYAVPVLALFGLLRTEVETLRQYTYYDRNFYGSIRILDDSEARTLYNGNTTHGKQYFASDKAHKPNMYYAPESGIGRAIMHERSLKKGYDIRFGVIGLGSGAMAAYCTQNDAVVFYEIDRDIEDVARDYFTYLEHCPQAEVVLGDGRIMLEREFKTEGPRAFDVLAIDAFTDDTIPAHLLTREALNMYRAHMASSSSIIAVHVSNRYLNLVPVLMAYAQREGLSILSVSTGWSSGSLASPSQWVLLSEDPRAFTSDIFKNAYAYLPQMRVHEWTDDFSDILSVVMW